MNNTDEFVRYIKVNFPLTADAFASGNGEGMWVKVNQFTYDAYQADAVGGIYAGVLDNKSLYYPELDIGDTVWFEMRGDLRPVAIFDGFLSKLKAITPEEKNALLARVCKETQVPDENCDHECEYCSRRNNVWKHLSPEWLRQQVQEGAEAWQAEEDKQAAQAEAQEPEWFGSLRWCAEDLLGIATQCGITMTQGEAVAWWEQNESTFKNLLTEAGNQILTDMVLNTGGEANV